MDKLAGMSLKQLRQRYHDELFNVLLPFWDKHGIDHQNGGFMCTLGHDGALANTDKFHWFQGRGIWVYSYLYNHFGKDPRYLEVARKTKDFALKYFPQKDGWWAELVSRDGKVIRPFAGDIYGMLFAAEGLQEYAYAANDDQARQTALQLLKKLFQYVNKPDVRLPETPGPGVRPQGLWMVNIRTATQILEKWNEPEIAAIADRSLDAIINKHYNAEIGLNTELLNFDFSRPKGYETRSVVGHSVETLWMVMDEVIRRKDQALYNTCVERVRHHLDVGWDHVYGGLVDQINVDQGCYEWPVQRPVGTTLEFRARGEHNYLKSFWSVNEVLVATLNVLEHAGAEWAARYFDLAQEVIDQKFSAKKHGYPLYTLFTDRRVSFRPEQKRQDNYHPPRTLMLNILTLDRMIQRGGAPTNSI